MVPSQVGAALPEPAAFARAVRARRPGDGTCCEAWTVRDVVAHQAGNIEELARLLRASPDLPPETRISLLGGC
ncbi:maleylpyruvate isomerase N-terminal domain-containing protein [Streptomyces abikoensis]|uniref:maleylpyruvate isomerase N-terminal domain-containing protein n=1 Tax=Streptomyces abikoensis TaxID=97398 RepID=UPI003724B55F